MPDVVIAFDHLAQTATLATHADEGANARLAVGPRTGSASSVRERAPGPVRPATRSRVAPPARDPRYEAGVPGAGGRDPRGRDAPGRPRAPVHLPLPCRRAGGLPRAPAHQPVAPPVRASTWARALAPGRLAGAARPRARRRGGHAADRRDAAALRRSRCRTRNSRRTCSPTRRSCAEHAMLVDLARNDVGRIAARRLGRMAAALRVERYSHVMHLVSEVRGRLRDGAGRVRCASASTFPAGTLSRRARRCVPWRRSPRSRGSAAGRTAARSGSSRPTDVEAAITIRSAVLKDGIAYVHAGAGIVADSVPERESAEVAAKAGAVLAALSEAESAFEAEQPRRRSRREGQTVMSRDPAGRQLRLVHLEPVPVDRGHGRRRRRSCATTRSPWTQSWPTDYDGVVLSPGPSRPEKAGICVDLIRALGPTTPMLGVCLGHQAMGVAYGGDVITVEPVHGKRSAVEHDGAGLLRGPPLADPGGALPLAGHPTRVTLPDELELTAWSPDGLVMGVRHREYPRPGHPVPPRVDPHRCRAAAAAGLAGPDLRGIGHAHFGRRTRSG